MNAVPQTATQFDPSRERRTQIVGQLIAKNNGLPCPHLQVTALLQGFGGAHKMGSVRADADGRFVLALQTPAPRYGEQQAIFLDVADSAGQLVGRSEGIVPLAGAPVQVRVQVACAARGQQAPAPMRAALAPNGRQTLPPGQVSRAHPAARPTFQRQMQTARQFQSPVRQTPRPEFYHPHTITGRAPSDQSGRPTAMAPRSWLVDIGSRGSVALTSDDIVRLSIEAMRRAAATTFRRDPGGASGGPATYGTPPSAPCPTGMVPSAQNGLCCAQTDPLAIALGICDAELCIFGNAMARSIRFLLGDEYAPDCFDVISNNPNDCRVYCPGDPNAPPCPNCGQGQACNAPCAICQTTDPMTAFGDGKASCPISGPQPQGSPCSSNAGCTSGICFAGVCGAKKGSGTEGAMGKPCSADKGCQSGLSCKNGQCGCGSNASGAKGDSCGGAECPQCNPGLKCHEVCTITSIMDSSGKTKTYDMDMEAEACASLNSETHQVSWATVCK